MVRLGVSGVTVDGLAGLAVTVLPSGRGIKADFVVFLSVPLFSWLGFSGLFFFAILRPLIALFCDPFSELSSIVSSLLSFVATVLPACCRLNAFQKKLHLMEAAVLDDRLPKFFRWHQFVQSLRYFPH